MRRLIRPPAPQVPFLLLTALAALAALAVLPAPSAAQSITIDSFATNQATQTLTFPPSGTSSAASVSGAGILGGERDLEIDLSGGTTSGNTLSAGVAGGTFNYAQGATITGMARLQWDGTDGSSTVNPTGLGGIDLTAAGTQDAILLQLVSDDLPADLTLTVYTDSGNGSLLTFSLPGSIAAPADVVLPYSAFAPVLGAGADFTNVGAITLSLGSTADSPTIVLDGVLTTSTVAARKTVALQNDVNGDGKANPGDTLRYTVVLGNRDSTTQGPLPKRLRPRADATGVLYSNATPLHTGLVIGSVTTSQGTVTAGNAGGDTSVGVDVGTIAVGDTVTLQFDVKVDRPLPAGVTQIVCQGTVVTDTLTGVLTDDPTVAGTSDPTIIPVFASPVFTATKADALAVDLNGDGMVNPGETIDYTVVLTNNGDQDAAGVTFASGVDPNTQLVVGSVTTSQGTVTTGNTAGDTSMTVDVGTLVGAGGSVTIHFRAQINDPLPPGVTQVACQGQVRGTNFSSLPTDDPDTPAVGDPTITPIVLAVQAIPTLSEWGLLALIGALGGFGARRLRRAAAPG
jgi:uncharacterized repeat protein (TIGR01451 family)